MKCRHARRSLGLRIALTNVNDITHSACHYAITASLFTAAEISADDGPGNSLYERKSNHPSSSEELRRCTHPDDLPPTTGQVTLPCISACHTGRD